jgi:hypothetical protein
MPIALQCSSCLGYTPYDGDGALPVGWCSVTVGHEPEPELEDLYNLTAMFSGIKAKRAEKPVFCGLKCLATWALLSQVVQEA